jgi:uncharacterized lipoprotein YmbA
MALTGCISASTSPTPRFYMLHAVDAKQTTNVFKAVSNTVIGISPVKIPEYQNRPQIVTQDKNRMITIAQYDRWGEDLDIALTRILMENIAVMLPNAIVERYPGNLAVPLNYQVMANVLQLESRLDQDLFLSAQWSIIDPAKNKTVVVKKSEFRQPVKPHDYSGLAEALSAVCASWSAEISASLAELVNQPQVK